MLLIGAHWRTFYMCWPMPRNSHVQPIHSQTLLEASCWHDVAFSELTTMHLFLVAAIKLRRDEKKRLNSINSETSSRMRFHVTAPNGTIKKRIQTHVEKIFVLTNDVLSGEPSALDFSMSQVCHLICIPFQLTLSHITSLYSYTLVTDLHIFGLPITLFRQDINCICTSGTRICRGMSDYFIFMKRYKEACNALTLGKCLKQRLWEKTSYPLKQLVGIGQVTAKVIPCLQNLNRLYWGVQFWLDDKKEGQLKICSSRGKSCKWAGWKCRLWNWNVLTWS
jgi:hypothetical protein